MRELCGRLCYEGTIHYVCQTGKNNVAITVNKTYHKVASEWSPIGHIRVLCIVLELASSGGLCGGISFKRDKCHLKRLLAIASVAS